MAAGSTKKITLEQDRKMFLTPCKNRVELKAWIKRYLGLELPDVTVSRYADTNPLDVVWEVYRICVLRQNPDKIKELLYVAGRGSGKCVPKGTKILTRDGLKSIEDINVKDEVWTGWAWRSVAQTFDEGIKQGVTITTRHLTKSGAWSLAGSLRHRIQALSSETGKIDWVHMRDLVPGQLVYKSMKSLGDQVDTSSSDYELGWIVGCIVGDGCVGRGNNTNISLAAKDLAQSEHYTYLLRKHLGVTVNIRNDYKSTLIKNLSSSVRPFREFFGSYIEGELCYFKRLRTLDHSPSFLAGFVSGMMETDGSKDSITLANPELVKQLAQILSIFGVHAVINKKRRRPSTTKFVRDHVVEYHAVEYKTRLPEYLMPLFSKRDAFKAHAAKMNEQFRYPSELLKPFADHIKSRYEISSGYWRLGSGKKTRSNIKYSKDLWGTGEKSKESYVYGYKIDYFIDLAQRLNEHSWVNYLSFVRDGCYEIVDSVMFGEHYFYDLEVDIDHAYWSNGFVSHNTLGMAIAELMVLLHDKRDVVHVGAIQNQADRCYAYQKNFLYSPRLKDIVSPTDVPEDQRILEKANMSHSIFNIGREKASIEVLPCTLKAVNGPHVPLVVVDEIDTVSGEGLKAFKDIAGMLDSKAGKPQLRVGISTRKSRYGLMNKQIESMEASKDKSRVVRRWTAFEFSERCPDSRSGTRPISLYVNQERLEVLQEDSFNKKDKTKQKEYMRYDALEGCAHCPLFSICLTDAKKQTSTSPMLKSLEDIVQKVMSEGADWALAQLMNLKPSVEGIIYREFDEKIHVRTWNQMWYTLVGKEYPGECTHDLFVKKCHELQIPCYAGIDWGFSAPNTVVYFFVDKRDNIYVVRTDGMTFVSEPTWIHYIKTKYHTMYRCQLYVPDAANQGAILEMQKAGLPVSNQLDKGQINTGVQVIKKFLRFPGNSMPKMFFAKDTTQHIVNEFGLYHYKVDASGMVTDDPDTEYDHWLDAIRYVMTLLFGKQTLILGESLDFDPSFKLQDPTGNYNRTPNPLEFAVSRGIRFNDNEEDKSRLGKIGTVKEIEDASDPDSGSGGGMLWTFD